MESKTRLKTVVSLSLSGIFQVWYIMHSVIGLFLSTLHTFKLQSRGGWIRYKKTIRFGVRNEMTSLQFSISSFGRKYLVLSLSTLHLLPPPIRCYSAKTRFDEPYSFLSSYSTIQYMRKIYLLLHKTIHIMRKIALSQIGARIIPLYTLADFLYFLVLQIHHVKMMVASRHIVSPTNNINSWMLHRVWTCPQLTPFENVILSNSVCIQ